MGAYQGINMPFLEIIHLFLISNIYGQTLCVEKATPGKTNNLCLLSGNFVS